MKQKEPLIPHFLLFFIVMCTHNTIMYKDAK